MKRSCLGYFFLITVVIFTSCDPESVLDPRSKVKDSLAVSTIWINTLNEEKITSKDKADYVPCDVKIQSVNKPWNFSGSGKIRGRGNSTWLWYDKKPYRLKLTEAKSILGLKSDKDWVFLANYRDPTHLMNTFVFIMGRGLGLPFTNSVRYAEVYLNNDYIGLYQITEQVEQGRNRVNVDYKEGLLLSLDLDDGPSLSPAAQDNFWSSVYGMPVCVKHPKDIPTEQLDSIKSELKVLETAIQRDDYYAVCNILDIPAFIDYLIIQELVFNVEVAAPRSIYIHRNKNQKWVMGPLWDFDAGFDFDWSTMYTGHNYFNNFRKLVLGRDPYRQIGGHRIPYFFTDLFKFRQFVRDYKDRWLEIKNDIMDVYWEETLRYAEENKDAMFRDFERWPIDRHYDTEIRAMGVWLRDRVEYLSGIIANYPAGQIY